MISLIAIESTSCQRPNAHMTHKFISAETVQRSILLIRNQKVILDRTLAKHYGVSTKMLIQLVKRNLTRFPPDFMFQLTMDEAKALRQSIKDPPYVFAEHGILMISSVLIGERVAQVNIEIVRTFVRLRETPASNAELTKRLDALEHDCKVVLNAIRKPMKRASPRRKQIGYLANTAKR